MAIDSVSGCTPPTTSTTTSTTTSIPYYLADVSSTLGGLTLCSVIGSTNIYLNSADYANFVSNSNCFLAGMVARFNNGVAMSGTIYVFDNTPCLQTWTISSGVMSLRALQC